MSDLEIMEFPYGAFLKLRLEFVLLRDNELEALIMRIIEGWMIEQKKAWMNECAQAASDGKQEPPEPDYFVTLSYAQIMAQLYMFNSSRKGAGKDVIDGKKNSIHRNTLTKAMTALIEDKYVITRPNPDKTKEYDATQYTLNLPLIQEHMRLLPKSPMSYLGSNGRIDGVPCPDFLNPPQEIPPTKFVNGGDAQKSCTPCTKKVHPLQQKSASPYTKKVQGDAQKSSHLIDREIDKGIDKDRMNECSPNEKVSQGDSLTHSSTPSSLSHDQERQETPSLKEKPSPEITRVKGYWKDLGYREEKSAAWAELAEKTKTFEEFKSLFDFTEEQLGKNPKFDSKGVHPGNMLNYSNEWVQAEKRKKKQEQAAAQPQKPKITVGNMYLQPLVKR